MVQVEVASLRHVSEIVEVHHSDLGPLRAWTRGGWREASPEELDPCRWVLNGGPWMSVETCAIHINNLLLRGQTPMVALEGDRVVGEAELIVGDEGCRRGLVAHVSVIQVHRDFRGRGVGRALVESAVEATRDLGARTLTVVPEDEAKGFYGATGFRPAERWVEVDVSPGDLPDPKMEAGLASPDLEDFEGMELVVGRYQSGVDVALSLLERFAGCDVLGTGKFWTGAVEGVEFISHVRDVPFLGARIVYAWVRPSSRRERELEARLALSASLALAGSPVRTLVPEGLADQLRAARRRVVEFWAREVAP